MASWRHTLATGNYVDMSFYKDHTFMMSNQDDLSVAEKYKGSTWSSAGWDNADPTKYMTITIEHSSGEKKWKETWWLKFLTEYDIVVAPNTDALPPESSYFIHLQHLAE